MAKFLFCEDCGSLVQPSPHDFQPLWCRCRRHATWAEPGDHISIYDANPAGGPAAPRAFVIGIGNAIFDEVTTPETIKRINAKPLGRPGGVAARMRECGSPTVTVRPGDVSRTSWETELPKGTIEAQLTAKNYYISGS